MATLMVFDLCWLDQTTAVRAFLQERSTEFDARFYRYHGLLHFVACRVLEDSEGVEEAIENCRVKASRNPPDFTQEGAFRSWLVRILIDEALAVRRRSRID